MPGEVEHGIEHGEHENPEGKEHGKEHGKEVGPDGKPIETGKDPVKEREKEREKEHEKHMEGDPDDVPDGTGDDGDPGADPEDGGAPKKQKYNLQVMDIDPGEVKLAADILEDMLNPILERMADMPPIDNAMNNPNHQYGPAPAAVNNNQYHAPPVVGLNQPLGAGGNNVPMQNLGNPPAGGAPAGGGGAGGAGAGGGGGGTDGFWSKHGGKVVAGAVIGTFVVGVISTLATGVPSKWWGLSANDGDEAQTDDVLLVIDLVNGKPVSATATIALLNKGNADADYDEGSLCLYKTVSPEEGGETTLKVDGEGSWSVGKDDKWQEVTFKPDDGFVGDPTPIFYTIDNSVYKRSKAKKISIVYSVPGEVANGVFSDKIDYPTPAVFDVSALLSPTAGSIKPDTIKLYADAAATGTGAAELDISGEGKWTVGTGQDASKATFTPGDTFVENPKPVFFAFVDANGHKSKTASLTVTYKEAAPKAEDIIVDLLELITNNDVSTLKPTEVGVFDEGLNSTPLHVKKRSYDVDPSSLVIHSMMAMIGQDMPVVQFENPVTENGATIGYTKATAAKQGIWEVIDTGKKGINGKAIKDIRFTADQSYLGIPPLVQYTVADVKENRSAPANIVLNKDVSEIKSAIDKLGSMDDTKLWSHISTVLTNKLDDGSDIPLEAALMISEIFEISLQSQLRADFIKANRTGSFMDYLSSLRVSGTDFTAANNAYASDGGVAKLLSVAATIDGSSFVNAADKSDAKAVNWARLNLMKRIASAYFGELRAMFN